MADRLQGFAGWRPQRARAGQIGELRYCWGHSRRLCRSTMTFAQPADAPLESIAISVRVVQLLMAAIEQTGVQRAELMRVLGSASVALDDGDAWITNLDAERVCELALALSGDPALGLRWAESLTERSFGPVSHLIQYAGSLRAGLAQLSASNDCSAIARSTR